MPFEYHHAGLSVDGPFVLGVRSKFAVAEEPNINPTMEKQPRRMLETSVGTPGLGGLLESAELSFPMSVATPLNALERYNLHQK